jgi:hypothetical protein
VKTEEDETNVEATCPSVTKESLQGLRERQYFDTDDYDHLGKLSEEYPFLDEAFCTDSSRNIVEILEKNLNNGTPHKY